MIFNFKGQSLIDIVISLGLLVIIISALSIATVNGLKNSQFSRNQIQATKLAQDTIEKIRSIKNNNYGICVGTTTPCYNWNETWEFTFGSGADCTYCRYMLVENKTLSPDCQTTGGIAKPLCLKPATVVTNLDDKFSRDIFIEDETTNQKKIRVKVYWTDSSGGHETSLVTVLSKY